jgi:hypothetical protein
VEWWRRRVVAHEHGEDVDTILQSVPYTVYMVISLPWAKRPIFIHTGDADRARLVLRLVNGELGGAPVHDGIVVSA